MKHFYWTWVLAFLLLFLSNQACYKKLPLQPVIPATPTPTHLVPTIATPTWTATPSATATAVTSMTPICSTTTLDLGDTDDNGADLGQLGQPNALGYTAIHSAIIRTQAEWDSVFTNAPTVPTAPVDFNTTLLVVIENFTMCPPCTITLDRVCVGASSMDIALTMETYEVVCMAYSSNHHLTAIAAPNNNLPDHWAFTYTGAPPLLLTPGILLTPMPAPTWTVPTVTPTP